MGILPRKIVGEEKEKLYYTLRSIYQDYRNAHAYISEKELLKRHIQNGGNLRRICEDAVPIADIVKTELKRKPRAGQTTVVLHSKDFEVKITLQDAAVGTDLQGQKENVEKFCRLASEL